MTNLSIVSISLQNAFISISIVCIEKCMKCTKDKIRIGNVNDAAKINGIMKESFLSEIDRIKQLCNGGVYHRYSFEWIIERMYMLMILDIR